MTDERKHGLPADTPAPEHGATDGAPLNRRERRAIHYRPGLYSALLDDQGDNRAHLATGFHKGRRARMLKGGRGK